MALNASVPLYWTRRQAADQVSGDTPRLCLQRAGLPAGGVNMTGACVTTLSRRVARGLAAVSGDVLLPQDAGYDAAIRVWNGAVLRQPGVIVRCRNTADVQRSVECAVRRGMPLTIRGGGHDWNGRALIDDGLVIDLSAMNQVEVDPIARTAVVGGGVTAAGLVTAAAAYGLTAATGTVGAGRLAGLALGGGYGMLNGRAGLACDNLIAAEVVLADGTLVRASADSHPDLWWALRGGGGNFGVVASMEVACHPVPVVFGGLALFDIAQALPVLAAYEELSRTAPDELTVMTGLRIQPGGQPALFLFPVWSGEEACGTAELKRVTSLGSPLSDETGPTTPADLLATFNSAVVDGRHYAIHSRWLTGLSEATAEAMIGAIRSATSPYSIIGLHHFHGASTRVHTESSAFGLREFHYQAEIIAAWDPA